MLICPVCGRQLKRENNVFKCQNNHSFDIASSGYCNLLQSSKSGDKVGDAKRMVSARREFLDRGYYEPLAEAVSKQALSLCKGRKSCTVDAGCGEGYYTRRIAQRLNEENSLSCMIGIDISKSAAKYASKRDNLTQYITASAYNMPISDNSADLVLSLFAPTPEKEFARVLKKDGAVICVVPGEKHLWELKCAVYDKPYVNREQKHTLDGFKLENTKHIQYTAELDRAEDIKTLFDMTPYSHRTPAEGKRRLNELKTLKTTLSFVILTFRPE